MNAIIGMSEMLNRSSLTQKQGKYVSDIRKSSGALLTIINDILDFSKIEAGKMNIVHTNFNLKMLLYNLHSMFTMLCKNQNLQMECKIADNLPEMIYGDETRLRQVLTNLLSNAVKYTNEGSVTLSAWLDETDVLQFDIKDTGIGIREEDKERMFKPFEQLDSRKNKNVVGTGLGLAVTYNLCQLMKGTLLLDSVYGKGSTFSVRLPYMEADRSVKEEISEISDFTAKSAKILAVDDIDINLSVVEALLSTFQIVPDLASSGKEAIVYAKENKYDIIFMDHMMPEMDGLETTKQIRALDDWNQKVPIIALTANAISGVEQMFYQHKLDDFLSKPLDISALNLCLKKWLPENKIKER